MTKLKCTDNIPSNQLWTMGISLSFSVVVVVVQYTKKFACLKRRDEERICIKKKKNLHLVHPESVSTYKRRREIKSFHNWLTLVDSPVKTHTKTATRSPLDQYSTRTHPILVCHGPFPGIILLELVSVVCYHIAYAYSCGISQKVKWLGRLVYQSEGSKKGETNGLSTINARTWNECEGLAMIEGVRRLQRVYFLNINVFPFFSLFFGWGL